MITDSRCSSLVEMVNAERDHNVKMLGTFQVNRKFLPLCDLLMTKDQKQDRGYFNGCYYNVDDGNSRLLLTMTNDSKPVLLGGTAGEMTPALIYRGMKGSKSAGFVACPEDQQLTGDAQDHHSPPKALPRIAPDRPELHAD